LRSQKALQIYLQGETRLSFKKIITEIIPWLVSENQLNPEELFRKYRDAYSNLSLTQNLEVGTDQILEHSKYLFNEELERRLRIDSTAANLLNILGVIAAFVVGTGSILLTKGYSINHIGLLSISVAYGISLLYIASAFLVCLRVLAHDVRYYMDPLDISQIQEMDRKLYDLSIAKKLLEYTTENYKVNNRQINRIQVTRALFRIMRC